MSNDGRYDETGVRPADQGGYGDQGASADAPRYGEYADQNRPGGPTDGQGRPQGEPQDRGAYGQTEYGQAPAGQAQYGQAPAGQAHYGQQQYPQGGGGYEPARPASSGLAIASLVCGILALLGSLFFGGILGVVAVVLGFIALSAIRKGRAAGKGMAIAGIVTGVLSILVTGAVLAMGVALFNNTDIKDCANKPTQAEQQQCIDNWGKQQQKNG